LLGLKFYVSKIKFFPEENNFELNVSSNFFCHQKDPTELRRKLKHILLISEQQKIDLLIKEMKKCKILY
jgi:hypothetical protein